MSHTWSVRVGDLNFSPSTLDPHILNLFSIYTIMSLKADVSTANVLAMHYANECRQTTPHTVLFQRGRRAWSLGVRT